MNVPQEPAIIVDFSAIAFFNILDDWPIDVRTSANTALVTEVLKRDLVDVAANVIVSGVELSKTITDLLVTNNLLTDSMTIARIEYVRVPVIWPRLLRVAVAGTSVLKDEYYAFTIKPMADGSELYMVDLGAKRLNRVNVLA